MFECAMIATVRNTIAIVYPLAKRSVLSMQLITGHWLLCALCVIANSDAILFCTHSPVQSGSNFISPQFNYRTAHKQPLFGLNTIEQRTVVADRSVFSAKSGIFSYLELVYLVHSVNQCYQFLNITLLYKKKRGDTRHRTDDHITKTAGIATCYSTNSTHCACLHFFKHGVGVDTTKFTILFCMQAVSGSKVRRCMLALDIEPKICAFVIVLLQLTT